MTNAQNLVAFIKSHGNDAFLTETDSGVRIEASVQVVYPNGEVKTEWELVAPTKQAVRDWLGY